MVIRRRQKKDQPDVEGTSLELWHEGICPVCLALYATNQMRLPVNVEGTMVKMYKGLNLERDL